MKDDDFDLLGEDAPEEPSPRKPGRPRKGQSAEFLSPVSVSFLMDVFGMDRRTVKAKLKDLEPAAYERGQSPTYHFRQAAAYLVKPKFDVAAYIEKMGTGDLPHSLQKDVWDARLKEQKWRLEAGELWRTTDVIEVLGEAFKRLRTAATLWVDGLAEEHEMTAAQRTGLAARVDALMADMHQHLVQMPRERQTPSNLSEIDEATEGEGTE